MKTNVGKYEILTNYIPLIKKDNIGEWVINRENDGSPEQPIYLPFVNYSEVVKNFNRDLYAFCEAHPEYEHTRYRETLKSNSLGWGYKLMSEADISTKDSKCVVALLMGASRLERFCDGALIRFFKDGSILRWLERLKEIDGQES